MFYQKNCFPQTKKVRSKLLNFLLFNKILKNVIFPKNKFKIVKKIVFHKNII